MARAVREDAGKAINSIASSGHASPEEVLTLNMISDMRNDPSFSLSQGITIVNSIRDDFDLPLKKILEAMEQNARNIKTINPTKERIGGGRNYIYMVNELESLKKMEKIRLYKPSSRTQKFLGTLLERHGLPSSLQELVSFEQYHIKEDVRKDNIEMFSLLKKIFDKEALTSFRDVVIADNLLSTFQDTLEEEDFELGYWGKLYSEFDRIQKNLRKLLPHTNTGAKMQWEITVPNKKFSSDFGKMVTYRSDLGTVYNDLVPGAGKHCNKVAKMQRRHLTMKRSVEKIFWRHKENFLNILSLGDSQSELSPVEADETIASTLSEGEKTSPGFTKRWLKYMKETRPDSKFYPEGLLDYIRLKSLVDSNLFSSIDNPKMWQAFSLHLCDGEERPSFFFRVDSPEMWEALSPKGKGRAAYDVAQSIDNLDRKLIARFAIFAIKYGKPYADSDLEKLIADYVIKNKDKVSPKLQELIERQTWYTPSVGIVWNLMFMKAMAYLAYLWLS